MSSFVWCFTHRNEGFFLFFFHIYEERNLLTSPKFPMANAQRLKACKYPLEMKYDVIKMLFLASLSPLSIMRPAILEEHKRQYIWHGHYFGFSLFFNSSESSRQKKEKSVRLFSPRILSPQAIVWHRIVVHLPVSHMIHQFSINILQSRTAIANQLRILYCLWRDHRLGCYEFARIWLYLAVSVLWVNNIWKNSFMILKLYKRNQRKILATLTVFDHSNHRMRAYT